MGRNRENLEFKVGDDHAGQRLDHVLVSLIPEMSRSRLKKLIQSGNVFTNNHAGKASLVMNHGDVIRVSVPEEPSVDHIQPIEMPLDILYEDDDLIVINKPSGLTVHPGAGDHGPTLVEGLLHHCRELSEGGGQQGFRPGIVHRLDRDTTGALVCAKNDFAHRHLAEQFQKKTNKREYIALLGGVFSQHEKTVESYLTRDPKNRLIFCSIKPSEFEQVHPDRKKAYRWSRSWFQKVANYGHRLSLVRVRLDTGRTHQIRVHSASLNCPVLGDQHYGRNEMLPETFARTVRDSVNVLKRQMLHGETLGFVHPVTGEYLEFKAPLPADFLELIGKLEPYRLTD